MYEYAVIVEWRDTHLYILSMPRRKGREKIKKKCTQSPRRRKTREQKKTMKNMGEAKKTLLWPKEHCCVVILY